MTGRVGLLEVISTFIDLNEEFLIFKKDPAAPVFADKLNFITTFSGSANPKVMLSPPVSRAFQFAEASMTNSASRTEKNTVYIGLSLEPTTAKKFVPLSEASFGTVFARRNLEPSSSRAVSGINTFRNDLYLDRSITVQTP